MMTSINLYSKEQTDALLGAKADKSDTYTKAQVDTALGAKANSSDVYTKTESDNLFATKTDIESTKAPLIFKEIAGLTITANPDLNYYFKQGNIIVVNVAISISGTYTGSEYWEDIFEKPASGVNYPYIFYVRGTDGIFHDIHQGNKLHPGSTPLNTEIWYQTIYTIGS